MKSSICKECGGSGYIEQKDRSWMREKRKAHGLSLREVARRLKISVAYLSDIELGKRSGNEKIISFFNSL